MDDYGISDEVYKFYRNRTVIVTGATGFLGQHLVSMLSALKAEILPISSKDVDLRSEPLTDNYFQNNIAHGDMELPGSVLFHLAANVSGIHDTALTPLAHLQDNVRMATNVMRNVHRCGIRYVVAAGSVCAYPQHTPCPMVEENLWEGKPEPTNFSYGESKRFILSLIDAYLQQNYISNYAFLLSANLYGPHDHFDPRISHVIPSLIRKVGIAKDSGESLEVWGTGGASRDFLYVGDAAMAYMFAGYKAMSSVKPIVANIGSGREITIAALAETISRLMNYTGGIVYDAEKPDGQMRRSLSNYRANNLLAWRPTTELEDGLRRTIQWYETTAPARDRNFQYLSSHQTDTST